MLFWLTVGLSGKCLAWNKINILKFKRKNKRLKTKAMNHKHLPRHWQKKIPSLETDELNDLWTREKCWDVLRARGNKKFLSLFSNCDLILTNVFLSPPLWPNIYEQRFYCSWTMYLYLCFFSLSLKEHKVLRKYSWWKWPDYCGSLFPYVSKYFCIFFFLSFFSPSQLIPSSVFSFVFLICLLEWALLVCD